VYKDIFWGERSNASSLSADRQGFQPRAL